MPAIMNQALGLRLWHVPIDLSLNSSFAKPQRPFNWIDMPEKGYMDFHIT